MVRKALFEAWANVLQYPGGGRRERVTTCIDEIATELPHLHSDLEPLASYTLSHQEEELEEAFTRTFDSNAERALEVGWHLHGENYARGVFMVRMRKMLRDHSIDESNELPDHISHVLSVLAKAEPVLGRALATTIVKPALAKIEEGFGDASNPYLGAVASLRKFIEAEYSEESGGKSQ